MASIISFLDAISIWLLFDLIIGVDLMTVVDLMTAVDFIIVADQ